MAEIKKMLLSEEYYNDRIDKKTGKPVKIDMLILHCAAYSSDKLIQVFKDFGVSSHYIIDQKGYIIQLVDESKRAWHAGIASWNDITDINSHSIGIEVLNSTFGHSEPYTAEQIKALIDLSKAIIKKYQIPPHNVIAHSDIAPLRKFDPGRLFPWEKLAKEGIGLWPKESNKQLKTEKNLTKLLAEIGYSIENEQASLRAFLRHFIPEYIPGKENPNMDQYEFLSEYDKNLQKTLDSPILLDQKISRKLNQVARLFKKSRQNSLYYPRKNKLTK